MTATNRAATPSSLLPDVMIYRWSALDGDDYGDAVKLPRNADKCVQFGINNGAASAGQNHGSATTTFQGSNDPLVETDPVNAIWFTLHDPLGNNISVSSNGIKQILENPIYVRPFQTGGSAGNLDVVLVCKK